MQVSGNELTDDGQPGATASGRGRKMYYSISEVCAMTGVGQHVLRYWEKEFSLLRPKKNSGGRRAYMEKDIDAILKIKHMLKDEKYSLHGAKDKLLGERRERRTAAGRNAATAVKRRKTDAAGRRNGSASTTATTVPTEAAAELTGREFVRNDDNGGRGGDKGNALILSVRDGLLEVLGLLES